MPPYESVQAAYDSIPVTPTISADINGSWTGQFITPSSPAGYHYVTALGNFTLQYEVNYRTFTITPAVKISPSSGCVGTQVTVTGMGFASLGTRHQGNVRRPGRKISNRIPDGRLVELDLHGTGHQAGVIMLSTLREIVRHRLAGLMRYSLLWPARLSVPPQLS